MNIRQLRIVTGLVGLLGALLVGTGEYLLHYSSAGYQSAQAYYFFLSISDASVTTGHFLAIFALPLYLVGYYHIFLMLEGAPLPQRLIVLIGGCYGLFIGGIWLGSRAYLHLIATRLYSSSVPDPLLAAMLTRASFLNETLIWATRAAILISSLTLALTIAFKKTLLPRWMALINPIFLVIASFLLYLVLPVIGRHVMPIAMNAAHIVFFSFSSFYAWTCGQNQKINNA